MSRILIAILLVPIWASCLQGAEESPFQVDLSCGWDGYYRPMEWTPVEIGITADLSEPFDGSLTVTARQDGLNTLHVVHRFVLTPNQPLTVPLVSKFAFQIGTCTVTIRDKQGRTRWETVQDIWDFSNANRLLRVVQENDVLIGVVGQPHFGVLRLPASAVSVSPRGPGEVRIGMKSPRMSPWDWTGFAGLDLLVLYDPDWTMLNEQQTRAICDWVANGGTLLLRVVQENDVLIGLVGQPHFGVLRLPDSAVSISPRGPGEVRIGMKSPRMAPWDWTGFAGLDLLVLYDPDWTLLNEQQTRAICDWVSNGGTLVLVLGRHPLPPGSPLARLIPFEIGDLRTCEVPSQVLTDWGLDAGWPETVSAWSLSPKPGAIVWANTESPDAGSLRGAGYAGFGRVAMLGFDPSQLSAEQAQHSGRFWTRQVAACLEEQPGSEAQPAGSTSNGSRSLARCRRTITFQAQADRDTKPPGFGLNRYRISIARSAGNRVVDHLYRLAQMRPPSLWWLILPLAALAILLGPVDYLVLKRLNRLPLTWLTSAGWILLFTAGAYYGVQYIRGGEMQLRAVSVLDSIADSNCAWATYYAGLYAPRSDEYRLDGLQPGQWWAAVASSDENIYAYQRQTALRQLTCMQEEGTNLPVSMPVSIWTMQSLLGESPLHSVPFAAKVDRSADTATVQIANTSERGIAKGCVLWSDGCAEFGSIEAGMTAEHQMPVRPFDPWTDGSHFSPPDFPFASQQGVRLPRYPAGLEGPAQSAFLAQGCLYRSLTMQECLHFGAALVCVVFDQSPAPLGIKDCSYEINHIQYARQLVFEHRE